MVGIGRELDQEDVARLQIPVREAASVRVDQRVERAREHTPGAILRHRALPDQLRERAALEQLHHEVGVAVRRDAVVGQGDDVGVPQRGQRLGLALEPRTQELVLRVGRLQHLDRHLGVEAQVLGAIDPAHASLAEMVDELIAALEHRPEGGALILS